MKLHQVPARNGATWVRRGFAVFFKRPLVFAALFAGVLFFGLVALLLPFIGEFVMLAAMPLVSLGFMLATRRVMLGNLAGPGVFIEPLRGSRGKSIALVQMGVVYAVATFAILMLSDVADGGKFDALQDAIASGDSDAAKIAALLGDAQLQFGLLLRFGLASLLSLPFWHAPALVYWQGQGVGQALFSSTLAVWRCKGAFFAYSLAWAAVIAVFGTLLGVLFALFGARQLAGVVAMPAGLMFSTVFYVSLLFTYEGCFSDDTAPRLETQAA